MALGLTEPVTNEYQESSRGQLVHKADNLATICEPIV
jgi:hypothetical protein